MSDVKYQLRLLLPSLSHQARGISDSEIKWRYYKLKRIAESPKSIESVCRHEGKSSAWFFNWAKRLIKQKDLLALRPKSRRPKRSPKLTQKRVVKRIKRLREAEPFSGPERISLDLKQMYNIRCAPSTVHNVLVREGLIKRSEAKRLTKKHMKRYRREDVGYLQMDFKYVPYLINGQQYYQLSAVDHHSTWRMIRVYSSRHVSLVVKFLDELLATCPFAIIEIQTDNDASFTDKFTSQRGLAETGLHLVDEWCKKHNIRHRLIPPGAKELNGKVENTHKQDDREHFSQIQPRTLKTLVLLTKLYNRRWNDQRRTKALGWRTPTEAVYDAQVRLLTWLLGLKEQYLNNRKPLVQLTTTGDTYMQAHETMKPKAKPKPEPKNKTPRKTAVRRYLEWAEWDERSRKKS